MTRQEFLNLGIEKILEVSSSSPILKKKECGTSEELLNMEIDTFFQRQREDQQELPMLRKEDLLKVASLHHGN